MNSYWFLVWPLVIGATLVMRWRQRIPGVGLVLAYLFNFALIHWPGAIIYTLPWYFGEDPEVVRVGFEQSTLGLLAFGGGAILGGFVISRMWPRNRSVRHSPEPGLGPAYLMVGLFSYFVLQPALGSVPTLSALVSAGWNLVIVGLGLSCWWAWTRGDRRSAVRWVALGVTLPFVTIVTAGFLGYGTSALLTLLAFIATFYRPRWQIVAAGLLAGYVGLSFYVTYMRDRQDIRDVVWGGQSVGNRVDQVLTTTLNVEWFDPNDTAHLERIDQRLNQNFLVGAAVQYVDSGFIEFAHGETLENAFISLVPRALWPNKPDVGGSGDVVTRYTGIPFAQGTSVGVGQVMEFYINFGTTGVLLGFCILGGVLTLFDNLASRKLQSGDWRGFALWYLPGIGLLQTGGAIVEVTSSVGSAAVTALLVNRFLPRTFREGQSRASRQRPAMVPRRSHYLRAQK